MALTMNEGSRPRRCRSVNPDDPTMQCQGEVTELSMHVEDHWNGRGGAIVRWPFLRFPATICANCRHKSGQHSEGGCSVGFASNSPCGCPMEYDHVKGHLVDPQPVANPERVKLEAATLPDVPVPVSERQVGGNHYRQFKIQPWDVIDEYGLTFYAGNALKYLLRAGRKGVALEDLKKARHYLDKMIELEEQKEE